ncbi:MAG: hypothetical protein QXP36_11020 [Conexivisphaerales archaeon]
MSIGSVAKKMNISRNSARKYLKSKDVKKHVRKKGSRLDPYKETIMTPIEKHNLSAFRIIEKNAKERI